MAVALVSKGGYIQPDALLHTYARPRLSGKEAMLARDCTWQAISSSDYRASIEEHWYSQWHTFKPFPQCHPAAAL